jgi:hypothetical protein
LLASQVLYEGVTHDPATLLARHCAKAGLRRRHWVTGWAIIEAVAQGSQPPSRVSITQAVVEACQHGNAMDTTTTKAPKLIRINAHSDYVTQF